MSDGYDPALNGVRCYEAAIEELRRRKLAAEQALPVDDHAPVDGSREPISSQPDAGVAMASASFSGRT